jgi:hypothetical protein
MAAMLFQGQFMADKSKKKKKKEEKVEQKMLECSSIY